MTTRSRTSDDVLVTRRLLAATILTVALTTSTACSGTGDDQGDTMKLSGNCSITKTSLAPSRVISESMVEKLVGADEWKAKPGLSISPQSTLEKAYIGDCAILPADESEAAALRISVVPKSEPQYAVAQRTLASGENITKVDDHIYTTADPTSDSHGKRLKGAKGVLINPDYALIVEILRPAEGVDAMKEAGPTVQAVADNLSH